MPAHRKSLLGDLLAGANPVEEAEQEAQAAAPLSDQRQELLASWKADRWAFLTGKDVDGRPIIWTRDEKNKRAPLRPFPAHLEYLRELVKVLANEEFVVIEKSRQVFATTTLMLDSAADCAFNVARRHLLSKHKEDEAAELLRDKVRFPWSQMPAWLQQAIPVSPRPAIRADFKKTASVIQGATENVAASASRGGSSTRTSIDEAAFQDLLPDIITASLEQTQQLVMWSTPGDGGPGTTTFKAYLPRYARVM